jgi:hypothetical protein
VSCAEIGRMEEPSPESRAIVRPKATLGWGRGSEGQGFAQGFRSGDDVKELIEGEA